MAPAVEIISPCLLGGPGGCLSDGYIVVDTVHIKAGHSLRLCWTLFSSLYPQNICRYIYFSPLLCWSVAPSFWLINGSLCFQGCPNSHSSASAKAQHLSVIHLGCPCLLTFDFWACFISAFLSSGFSLERNWETAAQYLSGFLPVPT